MSDFFHNSIRRTIFCFIAYFMMAILVPKVFWVWYEQQTQLQPPWPQKGSFPCRTRSARALGFSQGQKKNVWGISGSWVQCGQCAGITRWHECRRLPKEPRQGWFDQGCSIPTAMLSQESFVPDAEGTVIPRYIKLAVATENKIPASFGFFLVSAENVL